ncbi:cell division protein ZapC [Vibrio viridaestus]|uniref:Cell division protein ZapC n=1 Tax=Vibrio viridaestus TaxID=2487322 RepID=A0A3N9TGZ1_9VIBR|nr:cell division protein ZapC [Vibrio viridaestus]RQW63561.1 cell division protein ZapC [Vibrio viridaestus]
MLKPSDKWSWYFCDKEGHLMLDLGTDMLFRTNFAGKVLVDCAFCDNDFTVDDAGDYQTFCESISYLPIIEARKVELVLNCVAAKRFYKPVQPKSWFFDTQGIDMQPKEGELISLRNGMNDGHFVVIEAGDSSSLCICVEQDGFDLSASKALNFSDVIKVMHDRMALPNISFQTEMLSMVS